MNEPRSRRENIKSRKRTFRKLDDTPVEIPGSRRTIPDTRAMVRGYVMQALEQAGASHSYETAEAMIEEETDLEPMDDDPPWTSRYEVTDMDEPPLDTAPLEDENPEAPPREGEQPGADNPSPETPAE